MRTFILLRLASFIPSLFFTIAIAYILVQMIPPVDPSQLTGSDSETTSITSPRLTDSPPALPSPGIFSFFKDVLTLNWGVSLLHHRPVWFVISDAVPISAFILFLTILLSTAGALGIAAVLAALRRPTLTRAVTLFAIALHSFPLPILAIIVLFGAASARGLGWFPIVGTPDASSSLIVWVWHLALPVFCSSVAGTPFLLVATLKEISKNIHQAYATTAAAKGATPRRVLMVHVLRNSLLPIATDSSRALAFFFSGSIVIETVFSIEGIGRLLFTSALNRDFPVLGGLLILSGVSVLTAGLIADLLYARLDPRVTFR